MSNTPRTCCRNSALLQYLAVLYVTKQERGPCVRGLETKDLSEDSVRPQGKILLEICGLRQDSVKR